MKTAIAAVLALAVAGPALADNAQLAKSLGVQPGEYSTAELVVLKGAQGKSGNEGRVYLGNFDLEQTAPVNQQAVREFLVIDAE
ncbi:hypothetical protein [Psychromarinibacter sp. S121]|uniref:hypothetical protein n=1 Tax=Psychromarinibacter sp. S121 TaxID=3415127 RepID=UPI003C7ED4F2